MSKSRRQPKTSLRRMLQYIWLAIPLGVVGLVAVLALTQGRGMQQSQEEPTGLVDEFVVDSPGVTLPPHPAGVALPGTAIPDLGQEHIPEGQQVDYNSNPPTSGPHYEEWARWGIYNQAPQDEQLVHNLEHGGIIISYHPDLIEVEDLEQIREQAQELSAINPRIIVTPRTEMSQAIALTAWGYLQELEAYDAAAIDEFYNAHIARGPECQNGQCPN
ncbi:MAG: DUF3105 domain-containing protein [Leptolyngbyaceae cyanobacterium RM2_2_4]|nr:DUF3105 domain-containing protein [Leptolyngbyaceae cyanobacterium SM1_4_3]NJO49723.1 DUF3105 domain-containing protein [Leptolyngbyaceae cyanobacterium RM2_2_4]